MPVIQPLSVRLTGIEMVGTTETKVGVAMRARIVNRNDLTLAPANITGKLYINERPLVDINTDVENPVPLPPDEPVDMRIVLWVRSPAIGVRSLAEVLEAPNTRYRLAGLMLFRLPGNGDINDLLRKPAPASTQTASE
jgi:LEA14-like dessication related protein